MNIFWMKRKLDYYNRPQIRLVKSLPEGRIYLSLFDELLMMSLPYDGVPCITPGEPMNDEMLMTYLAIDPELFGRFLETMCRFRMMSRREEGGWQLYSEEEITHQQPSTERVRRFRERQNAAQQDTNKHMYESCTKTDKPATSDDRMQGSWNEAERVGEEIQTQRNVRIQGKEHVQEKIQTQTGKQNLKPEGCDAVSEEQAKTAAKEASLSVRVADKLWEFAKNRSVPMSPVMMKNLCEITARHVKRYGEEAVLTLIMDSIMNRWKTIIWDKLPSRATSLGAPDAGKMSGEDLEALAWRKAQESG